MPVIEGLVQNTPEWIIHRQGMVTASNMWRVMAKLKDPKKESAERARYKAELVCEVLTGRATEHYVSPAMETGLEREPLARHCQCIRDGIIYHRRGAGVDEGH